jgi:hypothetical protein
MLLQNRIDYINNQVKVYLEEIAKLQAQVTQLQAHAQEVQGAEQAAESALAQIDTALSMLQAICPDEIVLFKTAIDAKFNAPLYQLKGGTDNEDVTGSDTTPTAPDTEGVVETTFSVVADDSDDSEEVQDNNDVQPQETASNLVEDDPIAHDGNGNGHTNDHSDGNGHHLLTYRDLQIVDRPTLIKLANSHNLPNFKSKKRDELASLLDGMVTQAELVSAQNGKH